MLGDGTDDKYDEGRYVYRRVEEERSKAGMEVVAYAAKGDFGNES